MKQWILRAGMCVPFAFLAMGCDAMWDMFLPYPAGILCAALLVRAAKRRGIHRNWWVCSLISTGLSVALSACVTVERWQWYFKPFSAQMMALILSALMLGAQWVVRKKSR